MPGPLWILRILNLGAALSAVSFFAPGQDSRVAFPAAVIIAAAALETALSSRREGIDAKRRFAFGGAIGELLLLVWMASWARCPGGMLAFAFTLPAALIAIEWGSVAGGASLFLAVLVDGARAQVQLGGPLAGELGLAVLRGASLAIAPTAAGMAAASARSEAASVARMTLARLRAAQLGEHLSFVLFQLRDYLVTSSSLAESVVLSGPKGDAKFADRAERLRRSVAELGEKMSRLLGAESALTLPVSLPSEPVDLIELTESCSEEARAAFAPDGVTINLEGHEGVRAVRTDRRQVELALMTVLKNAFEACAVRGQGTVSILLSRESDMAEIEITDDGGGIPQDLLPLLFQPLASARADSHGLGLGLSTARRVMERLGGALHLSSREGRTIARLEVPIDRTLPTIHTDESLISRRNGG